MPLRPSEQLGPQWIHRTVRVNECTGRRCVLNVPNPMHHRTIQVEFSERLVYSYWIQRSTPSIRSHRLLEPEDTTALVHVCGHC